MDYEGIGTKEIFDGVVGAMRGGEFWDLVGAASGDARAVAGIVFEFDAGAEFVEIVRAG